MITKFIKLWSPVIIWMAFIFCLSNTPNLKTPFKYDFILRKIAHITEYFILTFLLYRAFNGSFKATTGGNFVCSAIVAFLYAVSDELHQAFVPGRNCTLQDVFIDTIGIIGFYFTIRFIKKDGQRFIKKEGR